MARQGDAIALLPSRLSARFTVLATERRRDRVHASRVRSAAATVDYRTLTYTRAAADVEARVAARLARVHRDRALTKLDYALAVLATRPARGSVEYWQATARGDYR